uniref:Uncharacterized protein n=1 Tax=Globodera pallida TaxID=36090 RepID=A0A183CCT8_GLOPA
MIAAVLHSFAQLSFSARRRFPRRRRRRRRIQEKGNCPSVRPFRLPHSTRKMRKFSFVWHRMLFLLCGLFLLASLSQLCNSTPIQQQKRQQQLSLTKRFYAWDEMSAKRSLVPPLSNDAKLAIEQSETNADESEPLLESHSGKAVFVN